MTRFVGFWLTLLIFLSGPVLEGKVRYGHAALAEETRAASLYDDITRVGSRYPNRATDVTKASFERNLVDSGWTKSVSQDGKVTILQKDGAKYVLRDGAKSTGGPTADFYKAGSQGIDVKIRLQSGGTP